MRGSISAQGRRGGQCGVAGGAAAAPNGALPAGAVRSTGRGRFCGQGTARASWSAPAAPDTAGHGVTGASGRQEQGRAGTSTGPSCWGPACTARRLGSSPGMVRSRAVHSLCRRGRWACGLPGLRLPFCPVAILTPMQARAPGSAGQGQAGGVRAALAPSRCPSSPGRHLRTRPDGFSGSGSSRLHRPGLGIRLFLREEMLTAGSAGRAVDFRTLARHRVGAGCPDPQINKQSAPSRPRAHGFHVERGGGSPALPSH